MWQMSPGRPPEARIERATRSAQLSMSRLGVADDGGLAGGAARRVQADDLLARHGEQAEGIGVAQVGLLAEREPGKVLEPDAGRRDGRRPASHLSR